MGIRSTAILFGSWIRPLLIGFAVIFVTTLAGAGYINKQGPAYFMLSVGGAVIHLLWQFLTVDLAVPDSCWSAAYISLIESQCTNPKILAQVTSNEMVNWDGSSGLD